MFRICWFVVLGFCKTLVEKSAWNKQLVGGWTNPVEKYARQIGSFPEVGVNITIFESTNQKKNLRKIQTPWNSQRAAILWAVGVVPSWSDSSVWWAGLFEGIVGCTPMKRGNTPEESLENTINTQRMDVPLPTYPYGKSLYKPYIMGIYWL